MLKKLLLVFFVFTCIISIPVFGMTDSTVYPITTEQIIVNGLPSEVVVSDKTLFVTVNVTNTKIFDVPLKVSVVRLEPVLPFIDMLDEGLNVSVLHLTYTSGEFEKLTPQNRQFLVEPLVYSENYVAETQLINDFFNAKALFEAANTEYKDLSKKYGFEWIVDQRGELAKLNEEALEAYKRWSQLKPIVAELRKEYLALQSQYVHFFETQLVNDQFQQPSFFIGLDNLQVGTYRLRFLDSQNKLVKMIQFKVVDKAPSQTQPSPSRITIN